MPQYQLPVAAALGACALFSAALLILSKPVNDGKVKLPEILQDSTSQDPFNITRPEDIIEGEPVDEARFWSRVRSLAPTCSPASPVPAAASLLSPLPTCCPLGSRSSELDADAGCSSAEGVRCLTMGIDSDSLGT